MSDEELAPMIQDMRENGYRPGDPICLYNGQILDGRNRDRAAKLTGVEPTFETFTGTLGEALQFVVARNVNRRHLTDKQRAAIAADVAMATRADSAKKINPQIAGCSEEHKPTTPEVAKTFNVSTDQVERAKKRKKEDPAAHAAAKAGVRVKPAPKKVTKAGRQLRAEQEEEYTPSEDWWKSYWVSTPPQHDFYYVQFQNGKYYVTPTDTSGNVNDGFDTGAEAEAMCVEMNARCTKGWRPKNWKAKPGTVPEIVKEVARLENEGDKDGAITLLADEVYDSFDEWFDQWGEYKAQAAYFNLTKVVFEALKLGDKERTINEVRDAVEEAIDAFGHNETS